MDYSDFLSDLIQVIIPAAAYTFLCVALILAILYLFEIFQKIRKERKSKKSHSSPVHVSRNTHAS